MSYGPRPECYLCIHFHPEAPEMREKITCDAFPDGIPTDIFTEGKKHRSPTKGDRGIVFEPKDEATAEETGVKFNDKAQRRLTPEDLYVELEKPDAAQIDKGAGRSFGLLRKVR